MTDPGLNQRLRQRSRRAGIMIGISMLLTIAVCVGSFSVIYAGLDDIVGDFVSRGQADPTPTPVDVAQAAPTQPSAQPEPTKPDQPTQTEESQPEPTSTPADTNTFTPDYQLDSFGSVNLRSGPGVNSDIVATVTMEQPLQYLGDSEPTTNPEADELGEGDLWMKFRTEDGDEGWIRAIDVEEYVP
ncbi:MAG TPA: SH3 domain-containing protein [Thermomicrobiales bacterium]|nr:SH3 domain-containing protein [Thermomicrobiales bacterium]